MKIRPDQGNHEKSSLNLADLEAMKDLYNDEVAFNKLSREDRFNVENALESNRKAQVNQLRKEVELPELYARLIGARRDAIRAEVEIIQLQQWKAQHQAQQEQAREEYEKQQLQKSRDIMSNLDDSNMTDAVEENALYPESIGM